MPLGIAKLPGYTRELFMFRFSSSIFKRAEGEDILLEHSLRQTDHVLRILQDQPVLLPKW